MTFLAFFIVPVTMKPKFFCWVWVALDLVGFLFYEMMGRPSPLWNGTSPTSPPCSRAYGYYRVAGRVDPFGGSPAPASSCPAGCAAGRRTLRPAFM